MRKRRLLGILVALGALAARGQEQDSLHPGISLGESQGPGPVGAATVCAAGPTLAGVDVSHYDGAIDWGKVAASGRAFAIAKATEGITFVDPQFQANWAGIKAARMVRGAYHFFRPADGGVKQADWFLSKVGAFAAGDLPPILDWEVTDGVASAIDVQEVQDFIDEVRSRTGLTTIIYTSARFLATVGNPSQFHTVPLWDAHWGVSCPDIPSAWPAWTFWQYSATGVVPGIGPSVDLNVFNGTEAQLLALTGAGGGPHADAGVSDAGAAHDGGAEPDAGATDGGPADAGTLDAGADGGAHDAGLPDSGLPDAGLPDGGSDGGSAHGDAGVSPGSDAGATLHNEVAVGCGSAGGVPAGLALLLVAAAALRRRRDLSRR